MGLFSRLFDRPCRNKSDEVTLAMLRQIALSVSTSQETIMATLQEQVAILQEVLAKQQKTSSEIGVLQGSVDGLNTKIAELQAIIDNMPTGDAPQELVDAVAAVAAQATIVDDQIPDVPAPPVVDPVQP